MDSASDFGSEGSRFESWVARYFFFYCVVEGLRKGSTRLF